MTLVVIVNNISQKTKAWKMHAEIATTSSLPRKTNFGPSDEKAWQNTIVGNILLLDLNETKSHKEQHRFCPQGGKFWQKFLE